MNHAARTTLIVLFHFSLFCHRLRLDQQYKTNSSPTLINFKQGQGPQG